MLLDRRSSRTFDNFGKVDDRAPFWSAKLNNDTIDKHQRLFE